MGIITGIRLFKYKKLEYWWLFDKNKNNFPKGRKHLGFKKFFWNNEKNN
jgi:hypothetical protein